MIRARAAWGLWNPYARRVIVRILLFSPSWRPFDRGSDAVLVLADHRADLDEVGDPAALGPRTPSVTVRAGRTFDEQPWGHSLDAPNDESVGLAGEGVGGDMAVVARLLERAQCGEHDEALRLAEAALREPTGDLADGAAGMHFVRVVALVV
jgi:hypothetical protein